jgi:hypothetical protein
VKREIERLGKSEARQRQAFEQIERIVIAGVASPSIPDGESVWALGYAEASWLHKEIMTLCGWTPTAAEKIRPFSEAARPLSPSMSSGDATDAALPSI